MEQANQNRTQRVVGDCIVCGSEAHLAVVTTDKGKPTEQWHLCNTCIRIAVVALVEHLKTLRGVADLEETDEL